MLGAGDLIRQKPRSGPVSKEIEGIKVARGIRFVRNFVVLCFPPPLLFSVSGFVEVK